MRKKNGRSNLVIKSIPFQVNKSSIIGKVAQLAKDKKIDGISDIRDELIARELGSSEIKRN